MRHQETEEAILVHYYQNIESRLPEALIPKTGKRCRLREMDQMKAHVSVLVLNSGKGRHGYRIARAAISFLSILANG